MKKLDILNREDFVGQLVKLTENISSNKASTSFAINGSWGCGKSFVLDMYEEQLSQIQSPETAFDKYFIVKYNCWKYDYYDEPLVAIVATMIDIINQKTKLWNDEQKKARVLGVLKAVGTTLLSMANSSIKDKTGVDLQAACKTVTEGIANGDHAYQHAHDYDVYFSFNQALVRLQKLISDLSTDQTVIFMVDELDRCLPEYAIKVLERLHHLTENTRNVITLISIDKEQLQKSVQQIFGFDEPKKYLEKFLDFEIILDYGTISERITEKYADYISMFDKDIFQFEDSIEELLQAIFIDIDVRTQEQVVRRAMLTHKLLYSDAKDYSFMCMELLLAVMICVYGDDSCFTEKPMNCHSFGSIFVSSANNSNPPFSGFFKEKFEDIYFRTIRGAPDDPECYILPNKANLYGSIIYTWYWMHKRHSKIVIQHTQNDAYEPISGNHRELKKFAETIKMIK